MSLTIMNLRLWNVLPVCLCLVSGVHAAVQITVCENDHGDLMLSASGTLDVSGLGIPAITENSVPNMAFASTRDRGCVGAAEYLDLYALPRTAVVTMAWHTWDTDRDFIDFATVSTGNDTISFSSRRGLGPDDFRLFVPAGYQSGDRLSLTQTFVGSSFTSLSLINATSMISWEDDTILFSTEQNAFDTLSGTCVAGPRNNSHPAHGQDESIQIRRAVSSCLLTNTSSSRE